MEFTLTKAPTRPPITVHPVKANQLRFKPDTRYPAKPYNPDNPNYPNPTFAADTPPTPPTPPKTAEDKKGEENPKVTDGK